jgi:hypothetical protein
VPGLRGCLPLVAGRGMGGEPSPRAPLNPVGVLRDAARCSETAGFRSSSRPLGALGTRRGRFRDDPRGLLAPVERVRELSDGRHPRRASQPRRFQCSRTIPDPVTPLATAGQRLRRRHPAASRTRGKKPELP